MAEPTSEQDTTALTTSVSSQEIIPVAYEMAKAYRGMVEHFRKHYKLEPAEADAKTRELLAPSEPDSWYEEHLRNGPPQEASWWELSHLAESDPEAAQRRWAGIKQAAIEEIHSGHLAAGVVDSLSGNPWERAQFLALRTVLMQEWRPSNGIEFMLLDTMAQAQTMYFSWMKKLIMWTETDVQEQKSKYDEQGFVQPSRVSRYEAMEQAAAMADRFNRLFLRTLRQLRDLRRYTPAVTIQNAGQVNIGAQQMNLAKIEAPHLDVVTPAGADGTSLAAGP